LTRDTKWYNIIQVASEQQGGLRKKETLSVIVKKELKKSP